MVSHYDPDSRRIHLRPDATLYAHFHENAHAEQHKQDAFVFRVWRVWRWVRGLSYVATVWIEWDANRRAERAMRKLGLWSDASEKEARQSLRSYITRREL